MGYGFKGQGHIDISGDLIDRLQETSKGPELRDWCQSVGLLGDKVDFADSPQRGGPISVRFARTFITNYFDGMKVDSQKFAVTETTPMLCPGGGQGQQKWEELKEKNPTIWKDVGLIQAAKEFAALATAQRVAFDGSKRPPKPDFPTKALNMAVMSAWAYVAGMLAKNRPRLKRHFDLRQTRGKDPLNAAELANGRHKSDPDNYRGLGYRTDAKERGRLVELFYLQAEDGDGITPSAIKIAIEEYHIKQSRIAVEKEKEKARARKKQ
jgi:hypothetical protein